MEIQALFNIMVEQKASDLYLTVGAAPHLRVFGQLQALAGAPLSDADIRQMAKPLLLDAQQKAFERDLELNFAIQQPPLGRFRINLFQQQGVMGMVVRHIPSLIPSLNALNLPSIFQELALEKRGLILVVGATGSGKSTSLAAMIQHRNQNTQNHIICIEDPIEYLHSHQKSLVNQREVGLDTESYDAALKNALRQSPDVIMIGEIRNQDSMEHALAFSETGHLCLSTLHANNANQALDRIIHFFPPEKREQILLDLSFNLKAIISQRLIPAVDNQLVAAIEVMLGSPLVLEYIRRGDIASLKEAMEKSQNLQMQTFDQSLEKLYREGRISLEEALKNADSRNNLRIQLEAIAPKNNGPESSLNLVKDDRSLL